MFSWVSYWPMCDNQEEFVVVQVQLVVINGFVLSYYTDDFAVEVEPGINPNELANDHNCLNQGEFLPNIFHFRHNKVHRRSATQSNSHRFNTDPRNV